MNPQQIILAAKNLIDARKEDEEIIQFLQSQEQINQEVINSIFIYAAKHNMWSLVISIALQGIKLPANTNIIPDKESVTLILFKANRKSQAEVVTAFKTMTGNNKPDESSLIFLNAVDKNPKKTNLEIFKEKVVSNDVLSIEWLCSTDRSDEFTTDDYDEALLLAVQNDSREVAVYLCQLDRVSKHGLEIATFNSARFNEIAILFQFASSNAPLIRKIFINAIADGDLDLLAYVIHKNKTSKLNLTREASIGLMNHLRDKQVDLKMVQLLIESFAYDTKTIERATLEIYKRKDPELKKYFKEQFPTQCAKKEMFDANNTHKKTNWGISYYQTLEMAGSVIAVTGGLSVAAVLLILNVPGAEVMCGAVGAGVGIALAMTGFGIFSNLNSKSRELKDIDPVLKAKIYT